MKSWGRSIECFIVAVVSISLSASYAGPAVQPLAGAYSKSNRGQQSYRSGNNSRVEGRVLSMESPFADDDEAGVQLHMDVGGREMTVTLGPRWFLNEHAVNLTEGQPVTIVGFTIRLGDKPAMIANELEMGTRRVPLRSPAGVPLWDGEKNR